MVYLDDELRLDYRCWIYDDSWLIYSLCDWISCYDYLDLIYSW